LTQAEASLRWSPEPRYHLEIALLKLSQLGRLASFEELLERFEALSGETIADRKDSSGSRGGQETPRRSSAHRTVERSSGKEPTAATRSMDSPHEGESDPADTSSSVVTPGSELPESRARNILEGVLDRVRATKPLLHAVLARHRRVSLDENCLRVWFAEDHKLLHERLEQKESRELLDRCASEVAGSSLRVEIGIEGVESPPSPEEKRDDERHSALRERALEDPLVRRFVETFQGEVDDVRDVDRAELDKR
jgi:hypothetical protein